MSRLIEERAAQFTAGFAPRAGECFGCGIAVPRGIELCVRCEMETAELAGLGVDLGMPDAVAYKCAAAGCKRLIVEGTHCPVCAIEIYRRDDAAVQSLALRRRVNTREMLRQFGCSLLAAAIGIAAVVGIVVLISELLEAGGWQ